MNDMSQVIVPKSDQINADDLIAGPRTITITDVQIRGGEEQPVSIHFDGSGKAYRPCKSMSRVLVAAWGPDAKVYVGRSLTLYRDATVKWAGMEVGGIRISHMSHINQRMTMALTATKGSRKPFIVEPLQSAPPAEDTALKWANAYVAKLDSFDTLDALNEFANEKAKRLADLESKRCELHSACIRALDARRTALAGGDSGDTDDWGDDLDEEAPEEAAAQDDPLTEQADSIFADVQSARGVEELDRLKADYMRIAVRLSAGQAAKIENALRDRRRALKEAA